jgi:hypothetical protein
MLAVYAAVALVSLLFGVFCLAGTKSKHNL